MTRSLTYTWPVYTYIALNLLLYASRYFGPSLSSPLELVSKLFITFGAIYYLHYSPFNDRNFLPLTTLLIIRFLTPMLVPFTQINAISFYMGSHMAILFFYSLRTLGKKPLRQVDYTKLILVGIIIILFIAYYAVLLSIAPSLPPDQKDTYLYLSAILTTGSQLMIAVLVLVHLWQIGKWEKDQLDKNETDLIDKIGQTDE